MSLEPRSFPSNIVLVQMCLQMGIRNWLSLVCALSAAPRAVQSLCGLVWSSDPPKAVLHTAGLPVNVLLVCLKSKLEFGRGSLTVGTLCQNERR